MFNRLLGWLFGAAYKCPHDYEVTQVLLPSHDYLQSTPFITSYKCRLCGQWERLNHTFGEMYDMVEDYKVTKIKITDDDKYWTLSSEDDENEPFEDDYFELKDEDGGSIMISQAAAKALVKAIAVFMEPE